MTAKKDLKRRIRARQAETGESYVTARRHVVAAAPAPEPAQAAEPPPAPASPEPAVDKRPVIHVDEMLDVTAEAEGLGFKCRVVMTSTLDERIADRACVLERIRDILFATAEDPAMEHMRGVIMRGERVRLPTQNRLRWQEQTRRFLQRARAGIGGLSDDGTMLAFALDGKRGSVMVLAYIGFLPRAQRAHAAPRLSLSAVGSAADGLDSMSVLYVP